MASKSMITLKTKINNKDYVYEGRFLGFIKDDEFNALIEKREEVAGKLESKETQSIMDIAKSMPAPPAQRLVMTVRKLNGVTINTKKLFVSPRCDIISSVGSSELEIELMSGDNSLIIEEDDNE